MQVPTSRPFHKGWSILILALPVSVAGYAFVWTVVASLATHSFVTSIVPNGLEFGAILGLPSSIWLAFNVRTVSLQLVAGQGELSDLLGRMNYYPRESSPNTYRVRRRFLVYGLAAGDIHVDIGTTACITGPQLQVKRLCRLLRTSTRVPDPVAPS
jgi:hypothetical protein